MKNIFTTVAVIAAFYINLNAQTMALDTSFGTGGMVSFPLLGEADDLQVSLSSDNKIFAYGKDIPSSASANFNTIYKLNLDGSLDTTFGTGGILTLPNYVSDFKIISQGSNKMIITFQKTSNNSSSETSILRYTLNGILDTTFANNGEFKIPYNGLNGFRYNNTVVLPDHSIILATGSQLIKLSPNGVIDTSYGNNGIINQPNSGNIQRSNSDLLNFYDSKIDKISTIGTPVSTFGTNGTFTYPDSAAYFSKQAPDNSIRTLDLDGNTFYTISSNGSSSNIISLTNDNSSLGYYNNFDMAGNKVYFVGTTSTEMPFIVSYDNAGSLIPLNSQNSYKEAAIPQGNYTSVLAKENTIYVGGDKKDPSTNKWYYVVAKYNVSAATLSTRETKSETSISFENPAGSNLVYSSLEKINKIELYSTDRRLLKTVRKNNADISDVPKGIYLVKTEFNNGKIVTKKLIKN